MFHMFELICMFTQGGAPSGTGLTITVVIRVIEVRVNELRCIIIYCAPV